jgi:hypothetical protein
MYSSNQIIFNFYRFYGFLHIYKYNIKYIQLFQGVYVYVNAP